MSILVRLQGLDLEIIKLNEKKEQLPQRLKELEKNMSAHDSGINELNERFIDLRTRKSEIEDELELESERLKKSQKKMSAVTNSREYGALQKEIDDIKTANKRREEELLGIEEELIHLTEKTEKLKSEQETLQKEVTAERKSMQQSIDDVESQIKDLEDEKQEVSSKVRPDLLVKYKFLSSKRDGVVVAAVTNGVCSACNMNIPPQIYNELLRSEKIMSCPSCQRLVYALKVE